MAFNFKYNNSMMTLYIISRECMTYNGLVGFAGDGASTLAVVVVGIDVFIVAGGGRLTGNLGSEDSNKSKGESEDVHDGGGDVEGRGGAKVEFCEKEWKVERLIVDEEKAFFVGVSRAAFI